MYIHPVTLTKCYFQGQSPFLRGYGTSQTIGNATTATKEKAFAPEAECFFFP